MGDCGGVEKMGDDVKHISQLKPDPRNARKHNPRNIGMIERALNEVVVARSIVIDEDNVILAGNGVVEAAANAGIKRVQVVDADGETIIAVRRRGLTPEQKVKLALYDNRTAELADWDPVVLTDIGADIDLSGMFSDVELAQVVEEPHKIGREGRLYNAGEGHEIEPFKLAYRVEAAYRAAGNLAVEVYAGAGQLTAWYRRRFARVVTNDKAFAVGD